MSLSFSMVSMGIFVAVNNIPYSQMKVPEQTCYSDFFFITFKILLLATFTNSSLKKRCVTSFEIHKC